MVAIPAKPFTRQLAHLTARQRQVLQFVEEVIARDGRPPSRGEVAERFGVNRATAQQHLVALEKRGAILRRPGARGLALVQPPKSTSLTPVVGRVPAGAPRLAIEDPEDAIEVPSGLFRRRPDALLRVTGDSMRDAGILDGDLVAIVLQSTADPGEIVVARVEQEITVKRLGCDTQGLLLRPANSNFEPRRIRSGDDFSIEAVVVGVLRRF